MYAVQEKNFGVLDLKLDSDGFFRRHIKPNITSRRYYGEFSKPNQARW
jgi:hypothetical protein